MLPRMLALGAALLTLPGCGPHLPRALPRAAQPDATQAQQLRTFQWSGTATTDTDNVAQFSLVSTHAGARGLDGHVHLLYGDRKGYFAGRSTLMAYVRLETSAGPKAFENVPMQLARRVEGVAYYQADLPVALRGEEADVLGLELAFASSDRYGHLTWDSADGRNYHFTRAH
ncbi:MAG: hypothetical protein VKQ33_13195 [Candidatus Sericytochromatia bacterium]|nr:hypothetical protein [Candidatus Sericytochromatia bacterium]